MRIKPTAEGKTAAITLFERLGRICTDRNPESVCSSYSQKLGYTSDVTGLYCLTANKSETLLMCVGNTALQPTIWIRF